MIGDLCPSCRSLQRGAALRCWKCGLDLTQPLDTAAAAVTAALPAPAIPDPAQDDALDESAHAGPCPVNFLARMFDPRITQAELGRAARWFKQIPFYESYRTLAALEIALGALLLYVSRWLLLRLFAASPQLQYSSSPGLFLTWITLLLLALAYGVYIGEALASAVVGCVAVGCWLFVLFTALRVRPFSVPLILIVLAITWTQAILFYKAFRTSLARRHHELGARVGRL